MVDLFNSIRTTNSVSSLSLWISNCFPSSLSLSAHDYQKCIHGEFLCIFKPRLLDKWAVYNSLSFSCFLIKGTIYYFYHISWVMIYGSIWVKNLFSKARWIWFQTSFPNSQLLLMYLCLWCLICEMEKGLWLTSWDCCWGLNVCAVPSSWIGI